MSVTCTFGTSMVLCLKTNTMKTLRKIFLVDDDLFSLNLYQQELENLGFNDITLYQNGTICLYNLFQRPSIIFLDHHMNDISGIEVLKKIKRYDPNIYVVMISGQESMKVAIEALKYGAFDYIIKGDNETEKIKKVIEKIELVEEQLKKDNPSFLQKLFSLF